jgi:hypothetical protein
MRRARLSILLVAVVVVLGGAFLLALPSLVRWAAVTGIRSATGRATSIRSVEVNLFAGRLVVAGLRIDARDGGSPLAELERLEARFRILPLLRGRLHLDALTLAAPRIHVARDPSGQLSIEDILERYGKGQPSKEPANVVLGRLDLERGAIVFEDRAVTPSRSWDVTGLTLAVRDIVTRSDAARGTVSARLSLAGAPATLEATEIRVKPARARATLTLTGLDLAPVWTYISGDPPVRPDGGRFTTRLEVDYSAESGARAGGEVTLDGLKLLRRGQDAPLVSTPVLHLTSRDVVYRDGAIAAGRLEVLGDPSIVDASVSPAQQFDLTAVHVIVEDATYPTRTPARVSVTAGLPAGGALDVRGTADLHPVAANLDVSVTNVDLTLARAYVPATAPITLGDGRLTTALKVGYGADGTLSTSGNVNVAGLTLLRRDQAEPFVTHQLLKATITDAVLQGGAFSLRRLELAGAPTIVDGSVTPPQRFTFTALGLRVEDATWPARGPARVTLMAEEGGGTVTAQGTVNPATLATEVRARARNIDLSRAAGYVPPTAPVSLGRGRLEAAVRLAHDRAAGTRIGGDGALVDLGLVRRGEHEPFVTDARLAFSIGDLVVKDGATSVASIAVRGAPALTDATVTPPRRLALRALALDAGGIAWPAGPPARVRVGLDLPEAGTLTASGTIALATRALELAVELKDAALAPYGGWLPIEAPLDGRAEAALTVNGGFGEPLALGVKGTIAAHALALGGTEGRAPVALERLAVTGLDLQWPSRLAIERVTLTKPYALLERNKDGSFPLRAMLTPRGPAAAGSPATAPSVAASPATDPAPASPPTAPRSPMALEIAEIVVEDGDTRFVDHSTTPFFSEEISRLALTMRGFRNAPDARADLAVQAVVGPRGALELSGQVAPLGQPFYLDLAGELRDIAMAQANPYMRFYSGWIARTGSVTTKVHYRIVGDELEASNDVHVQKIRVERAPGTDAGVSKQVGLPLGLIVAMITDSRGDIEFKVPVTGKLGTPGFSFGDAIWSAIKNVLVNVAAAPFRAIGKLFGGGGAADGERFQVDPVPFAAGSADVSPDAQQQLQRLADFMRASPYVKVAIEPVVSAEDIQSLKTQEVVARVQRAQRERALADFGAAVAAVWSDAALPPPAPKTTDDMIATLRDREPSPDAAIRRLAARRAEAARATLIETAGIEPARLEERDLAGSAGDAGTGRVQFELVAE